MTNKLKERPIIFSGPMVKAILEGKKTQTRRVIKPQPGFVTTDHSVAFRGFGGKPILCPYGQPGDRLWVREAFCSHWCDHVIYKSDGGSAKVAGYGSEPHWSPSIHMPRWASRITLEITGVRVERVQDIKRNPQDFLLEGILRELGGWGDQYGYYSTQFIELWNSLNAKRGYSWDTNPWVWVIEFKQVDK